MFNVKFTSFIPSQFQKYEEILQTFSKEENSGYNKIQ